MDAIIQRLYHFITETLLHQPGLELAPDTLLLTSGLVDSFHRVDLALFVEDEYGVKIDNTELNGEVFDTLAQLAALINQRRG
jgi:acyl carrier protein/D-alanine--poly(phosphoribitol) ligase subunit 2